ncbi:unnamed protein product [Dimorphilus gyrociliatus]|uniref:Uncharacterized protein n=1 Tax=Dimorphilus gyrociliatus TaxID=2664684 RepID=A0A7I8VJS5_9ANNE|nr:unnamed protein product [Dimorphilus gyrociliatus]
MSSSATNSDVPKVSISKYGIIIEEQKKPEPAAKPILKKESQISMQKTKADDENNNLKKSSARNIKISNSQMKLNKADLNDNYLAQSVMNISNLLQNQMRKSSFMSAPGIMIGQPLSPQFNPYDLTQLQQQSMMPLQLLLGQSGGISQTMPDGQQPFMGNFFPDFGNQLNSSQETTQDYEDMSSGGRVYKGTRRGGRLKVTDQPQVATYLREEKDAH